MIIDFDFRFSIVFDDSFMYCVVFIDLLHEPHNSSHISESIDDVEDILKSHSEILATRDVNQADLKAQDRHNQSA
jgi:hypothetical protein